jgi:hypothetical protein
MAEIQLPAVADPAAVAVVLRSSLPVPAMVANAGANASRRFLEFFAASIENDNTRMAYYRAVCSFFACSGRSASMSSPISSRFMSPPISRH